MEKGVLINGVKWAACNVDAPGTFAAKPEDSGMFYQWNRKKAWPATGAVTGWDRSTPDGHTWAKSNDPSPVGWRVPTDNEFKKLLDTTKVSQEWTTLNGVNCRKFTDRTTGNSLFMPASGNYGGKLDNAGLHGCYWSSTADETNYAYALNFSRSLAALGSNTRGNGRLVRAVAE